jgi:hypothetical protein
MSDPTDRCSRILVLVLRVAAVTFALVVLGWLVVQAQRNANGAAGAQAPTGDPLDRDRLLADPIVGEIQEIAITPATDQTLLPSTKATRVNQVLPPASDAAHTQTYLYSSKTITPLVMPVPPKLFLPSSKSGNPMPQPAPQNQRN